MNQFNIGDRVKKVTGDYQITGEVRSVFIDYCDDRIDAFLEHEANRRREHAEEIKREAA